MLPRTQSTSDRDAARVIRRERARAARTRNEQASEQPEIQKAAAAPKRCTRGEHQGGLAPRGDHAPNDRACACACSP